MLATGLITLPRDAKPKPGGADKILVTVLLEHGGEWYMGAVSYEERWIKPHLLGLWTHEHLTWTNEDRIAIAIGAKYEVVSWDAVCTVEISPTVVPLGVPLTIFFAKPMLDIEFIDD